MTEHEIYFRLHDLLPSDAAGLTRLASDVAQECREPSRTVLEVWKDAPDRGIVCAFTCAHLEELAFEEALSNADSVSPVLRAQFMETVVNQQLTFRELLLTVLEPLLKDQDLAEWPTPAGSTRTSEAAYFLVRRIVMPGPDEASHFSTEEDFLRLDARGRAAEIKRWLCSQTWKRIFPEP
ncbi:MAG: hypothetical protein AB1898_15025 [Acidobacteriota bacterium]